VIANAFSAVMEDDTRPKIFGGGLSPPKPLIRAAYDCQSHPSQLTVQDLWDNPAAVGRRLPQPGQLTIGEELLGYHNNNNN